MLSNHIDIVYQIRHLLQQTSLNIIVQYTEAVSANLDKLPTPIEKLMDKMHCGASSYYHHKTQQDPRPVPIPFPAQGMCIYHQSNPIVTNISEFLQESEREKER